MNTPEARAEYVRDLRALADWIEDSSLPVPGFLHVYAYVTTAAEFRAAARQMGVATKEFSDNYASLVKRFGPSLAYEVYVAREQVCTKIVVGQKVVPERTEELVAWQCSDSLLKEEGEL